MLPVDLSALLRQVLDVCLRLRAGERVWVNSWDRTLDLASGLAWACEKRKCPVVLTVQPENLWLRSIIEAPLEVVDGLPAHQAGLLQETDVYIYTLGPSGLDYWKKIPQERRKLVTRWFFEKNKFVEEWKSIARRRKVRMLGIEATLATPERAKVMGLDPEEWKRVMFEGCLEDYHEVARLGEALLRVLSRPGRAHITTPHGTDFRFRLSERPVDYSWGLATDEKVERGEVVFLPAGGAEVSVDEESGEGILVYDIPIRTEKGTIEQLSLDIEKGQIAHFSAESGREPFERYLSEGTGDVDRLGFFGLGLNSKLRPGFTQDDKVLGCITIGFGDNESKGGMNKASGHWWACMRDATVTIDDRTLLREGKLLV